MPKFILMSILAISIVIPAIAASEQNPRLALRKALVWTVLGIFAYVIAVVFVYPRLLG
jgi:predicted membrane channel-forming protein YqfA (hemolysin III family)